MTWRGSMGPLKGTGVQIRGANVTEPIETTHLDLASGRHGTEAQGEGQTCLRPHKAVPGHCLPSPDWGGLLKPPITAHSWQALKPSIA